MKTLASVLFAGSMMAASMGQAAPVTFNSVASGNAGYFNFAAGDWGLGEGVGTGPFELTVSLTYDPLGPQYQSATADFGLVFQGETHHMRETGYVVMSTYAATDSDGNAITVLSQSFGVSPEGWGVNFRFGQRLYFAPEVLAPETFPAPGGALLTPKSGSFSLEWVYRNDSVDIGLGFADADFTVATMQVSAVPEPASYTMMLGGLALAGALAVRRRRATLAC